MQEHKNDKLVVRYDPLSASTQGSAYAVSHPSSVIEKAVDRRKRRSRGRDH